MSRQLEKIGPALSQLLVNAGLTSFEKIMEKNPREVELILRRNSPLGNQILNSVQQLPRYLISLVKEDRLKIRIEMSNYLSRKASLENNKKHAWTHSCHLVVGDNNNNLLLLQKLQWGTLFTIRDNRFLHSGHWEIRLNLSSSVKTIEAHVLSGFIGFNVFYKKPD